MRILIAEDEASIARALKLMLEKNKYSVDTVPDGAEAVEYCRCNSYDALVLDIMMPRLDGVAALREIRRLGIQTPAMFLTAKGEVEDRVAGLDAGADDYLPKPFNAAEFLARVRALVRRSGAYTPQVLTLGNTRLDCGSYALAAPGGEVRLNNKEFQLLELFFRHPRQVFSAEHLMDKIWGLDAAAEMDVVWTYMGFLRRKLKTVRADVELRTIRGAGYALEETEC